MKHIKRMMALVIAMVMVLGMTTMVFAESEAPAADTVTITVNRDSTYSGDTAEAGREYTWYKIFSATYETSVSDNASGYVADTGVANVKPGGDEGIAYYATEAVATILKGTGNVWFDVQEIPDSTDCVITWKDGVATDAATLQAAAAWLIANNAYEATGSMTFNGTSAWTASVDKGYYVIQGDVGDNLVAATTDITINEKNSYPPLDKTQADEDNTTQTDDDKNVAIGDVLTYEVKVTIPLTAKVGDQILVYDKASEGLTYNNDVAIKDGSNTGNATVADATGADIVSGAAWTKIITVVAGSEGTDVVFTFTMTVNDDALVDTDKENESGLKYGHTGDWNYESIPDKVEYKTYFAGIHKIDGSSSEDLEGVEFTLKEAGTAFYVKLVDGVYHACPSTESGATTTVITDADGLIKIRGLDNDKIYTLTETKTLPGYNMLDDDVTLTLHLDTVTVTDEDGQTTTTSSFTGATDSSWGEVTNNQGTTLPSTGGIGTTIFYVIGAILVLGAGILLVTRRRMNAN